MLKKILLLNLIIFFLIILWFKNGLMFGGGEEGLPFYNPPKSLEYISFVWRDVDIGIPAINDLMRAPIFYIATFFYNLVVNPTLIQAVIFFCLLSIGASSIYLLIELNFSGKVSSWAPFIGGLFYIFNPYNLTQVVGRGLYTQFFAFSFLPLALLLFSLGLLKKNPLWVFLLALLSPLFGYMYSHPAYILDLWILLILYTAHYCFIKRGDKQAIFFALFTLILTLLSWLSINFWWIWPYLKISLPGGLSVALNNNDYNLSILDGVSKQYPLTSLIRLIHNGPFFEGKYYGDIYQSILFQLISWLMPLIVIFAFRNKIKKGFFPWLFFISLFICLGANFPTGFIFRKTLVLIAPLQAFRNPFEKFGVIYLISYSVLFAIGFETFIVWVNKKLKTHLAPLLAGFTLLLICGIYVWPLWYGNFAGGYYFNPWVKVPDYYQEANNFMKSQNSSKRIIQLPLSPGDGTKYKWEHSYQGIDLGQLLFDNQVIANNIGSNKIYLNVLLDQFGYLQKNIFGPDPDISNSPFRNKKFYEQMEMLNVGFVVVNKDIDWRLIRSASPSGMIAYLSKQENITKLRDFGNLSLYKVKTNSNVNLIYSDNSKVSFTKNNPTNYQINLTDKNSPRKIYFLSLFDKNWQLSSGTQLIPNHNIYNSYANSWDIPAGVTNLQLVYKSQDLVVTGVEVSQVGFVVVLLIMAGYFFKLSIIKK